MMKREFRWRDSLFLFDEIGAGTRRTIPMLLDKGSIALIVNEYRTSLFCYQDFA